MRSCFFCPFLWDHRLQIMIALNTGYFPACWGWDCWVFSASGTRSQASSVLTWSNKHLNLTFCNLTLLNLSLPFLNFIFSNGAEWMRSCREPCVASCTQGSGLVSMCFSWKGDVWVGSGLDICNGSHFLLCLILWDHTEHKELFTMSGCS